MAFDQPTRNRLARFVSDARALLTAEFTRQLQNDFGLDPATGIVADLGKLPFLNDGQRETARLLRATLDHYVAGSSDSAGANSTKARREALERIVREQAFTVLNRLCALRMAEARGLLLESIGQGTRSKGFQLYARLAGAGLGETGDAYRCYLFSLFDEFAVDLPVLFDRYNPQGRLFPREAALLAVLAEINYTGADIDMNALWAEDETIGWIYQYFNSKEERKAMRDASQAPRNSRELAVRNQFFTPRYVVEFLTDNTLGRLWYEMTKGETGLKESCRYLVRRPVEVFLEEGETERLGSRDDGRGTAADLARQPAQHGSGFVDDDVDVVDLPAANRQQPATNHQPPATSPRPLPTSPPQPTRLHPPPAPQRPARAEDARPGLRQHALRPICLRPVRAHL